MRYKGLYDSHSFDSLFDTLMVKAADQAQSNTDLLFSSGVFDPFAAALPFFVTPPAWENTTKDLSSVPSSSSRSGKRKRCLKHGGLFCPGGA